jgi:transcriptional regulator with XRE-family HTH domain
MNMTDFSKWLLQQIQERGWSQADLAKSAGLTRAAISDYINKKRTKPDPEALVAIANAFQISPIHVFRVAGLLPPGPADDITVEDWKEILSRLSERDQKILRDMALNMIDTDGKGRKTGKQQPAKTTQ